MPSEVRLEVLSACGGWYGNGGDQDREDDYQALHRVPPHMGVLLKLSASLRLKKGCGQASLNTTSMDWLNIAGLAFGFAGTIELARGLVTSRQAAIEVAAPRWGGSTTEQKLQLPVVQDRLRQRRNTIIGLALIGVGFLLQAIAAWPS
jgi:hypothetical protein